MKRKKPVATPEFVTFGVLPLQRFVLRGIALPQGTPARPRPDRPKLTADVPTTTSRNKAKKPKAPKGK